jgi:DNA ligase-1
MSKVRPMLAAAVKLEQITYPVLVSPKLDGIRGIIHKDNVLTRTLKPIPNNYVRHTFSSGELTGLDGEFILGSPTAPDSYRKTNSALMTRTGKPDATFYVFDDMSVPSDSYVDRLNRLKNRVGTLNHPSIVLLEQVVVVNVYEMTNYEEILIGKGYEGVIVRHPMGKYKYGRSTVSQGWMLKLKRFMDSEAVILGSVELMENKNEAVVNELGYMGRSSHMENKVPGGRLGAFKVCDTLNGWDFEIGTGFSEAERIAYWKQRGSLVGKVVKYKYFPVGMKDVPRHPSFIGFRDPCDM